MYSHTSGKFTAFGIMPLFLGSCLALIPQSSPAQIRVNNVVAQILPPVPNIQSMPAVEFQFQPDFQPYEPLPVNQYSQNFQSYSVVVNSSNTQTLSQVRRIEPDAYIRQYQGRSVIKSGTFSQLFNAENRRRELQLSGINNVQIVNFGTGESTDWGSLPPVNNNSASMGGVEFGYQQNIQPFQAQNFQRYLVLVNSSNTQTLSQVRRIEPTAYIRQYQGRSVIQAGIFSQLFNAENRVRQLQLSGINNAQIMNFSDGQATGFVTPGQQSRSTMPNRRQESGYYAVIPGDARNLPSIADNIRRTSGQYNVVSIRQEPLGSHVAVGPFPNRKDAELWNQYLQELGYGNARVYFGR
ncbi:hypothetical protein [Nodularia sp. UHCC 0506]|uniref:hypothetical protein n=1 Tax=Nodularia sp. UHCC 0506 TaxID=3110243 RepID=UPI002B1F7CDA|nr:hypothetical protein [Nodularia sp. UHCC 0506]MEA5514574.1 hypothetical protein [Nodularia sp. UHCC 0506]